MQFNDHEKIPATRDFATSDESLLAILKAFFPRQVNTQQTIGFRILHTLDIFSGLFREQNYAALNSSNYFKGLTLFTRALKCLKWIILIIIWRLSKIYRLVGCCQGVQIRIKRAGTGCRKLYQCRIIKKCRKIHVYNYMQMGITNYNWKKKKGEQFYSYNKKYIAQQENSAIIDHESICELPGVKW